MVLLLTQEISKMPLFAFNLKVVQHRPTKLNDDDVLSYRDSALTRSRDLQAAQLQQGRNIRRLYFCKNIATLGHSEWPYYDLCTLMYGYSALVRHPEHLYLGSCAMVSLGTLLQFPDPEYLLT